MKSLRNSLVVALALGGWVALAQVSLADFIGDTDGNTVTAAAGAQDSGPAAGMLVNGSGMLSSSPVTKTSTITNNSNGLGQWAAGDDISPVMGSTNWLLFTFTNPTALSEMVIWNGLVD